MSSVIKKIASFVSFVIILTVTNLVMRTCSTKIAKQESLERPAQQLAQMFNKEKPNFLANKVMRTDTITSENSQVFFTFTILDRTPEKARKDSANGNLYYKPAMIHNACSLPLIKEGVKYVFYYKGTDGSHIETLKVSQKDCLTNTDKPDDILYGLLQTIAAKESKNLPVMEGDAIRRDSIAAEKNQLTIAYTLLNKELTPIFKKEETKQAFIAEECSSVYMKSLLEHGAVLNYIMKTTTNEIVFETSISSNECKTP